MAEASKDANPKEAMAVKHADSKNPTIRRCTPYWHSSRVYAKGRWLDREILEMISTEFRDRSIEYYRYAIRTGATRVNGKPAPAGTIIRNGDVIENMRHRHEPPITSIPVKIVHRDDENGFIVIDKPPSVPVHGVGRYFKHSLVQILKTEFGIEKPHTINRLDRLTSGCMFIATNPKTARVLTDEIFNGTMRKEYVARCHGKFPEEEITVDQPLISLDRQMGLNIVHPEGKPAQTIFSRQFYDVETNTSVLICKPITGRTHQIRVHLQFIGYPIVNDPIYSDVKIWGPELGKGGIKSMLEQPATVAADAAATIIDTASDDDDGFSDVETLPPSTHDQTEAIIPRPAEVADSTSPEVVDLLQNLRISTTSSTGTPVAEVINPSDDLPFDLPSPSLYPMDVKPPREPTGPRPPPPPKVRTPQPPNPPRKKNKNKKKPPFVDNRKAKWIWDESVGSSVPATADPETLLPRETGEDIGMASPVPLTPEVVAIITRMRDRKDEKEEYSRWRDTVFLKKGKGVAMTAAEELHNLPEDERPGPPRQPASVLSNEGLKNVERSGVTLEVPAEEGGDDEPPFDYCKECFMPIWPDPKPSELFICLHALRYSSTAWSFSTEMPFWAKRGWKPDPED